MEEKNAGSFAEVRDPKAIRLLLDVGRNRLLAPFFGEAASVSGAAARLELDVTALLKQVQHFKAAGLLEIAREEPRKGRAVRFYRTPAQGFFVPARFIDFEKLYRKSDVYWQDQLFRSVVEAWDRRAKTGRAGVCVYAEGARVRIEPVTEPGVTWTSAGPSEEPFVYEWDLLQLSWDDAKAFQRELRDLLKTYGARAQPGEQPYIVQVALLPRHNGD